MRKGVPHIVALLLYGALAVLATWPLVLHLSTHLPAIPGELGQDIWQHPWSLWWVPRALLVEHTNPYTTTMLFYPQGASLYLHPLNLPQGILALVLLPLAGIVATYNIVTLLMLVLAGYCSFLLARYLTGNAPAALVGGAIVLCSPQRLFEIRAAQLPTLSDYGVPLVLLAVLIALKHRSWRTALLVAALLLLTGLCSWYHLFHALLVLTLLLVWRGGQAWREGGGKALRQEAGPWLRIVLLSALLILPFALNVVIEATTTSYARKDDTLVFSADILELLPRTFGGIWNPVSPDWWEVSAFGFIPLAVALGGVLLTPHKTRLWAVVAVVCVVLSLGPQLIIGHTSTGIPLPYALFRFVPVLDALRAPLRLNSVTTLMLGLMAAHGLAHLFRPRPPHTGATAPRFAPWLLALLLVVAIAAETVRLPMALVAGQVSPFYSRIADEPGEWSLLELPIERADHAVLQMYAQTYHHKAILTGRLARSVPQVPYEVAPPIAHSNAGSTRPDIVPFSPAEREQLLQGLRVRYLVLHTAARGAEETAKGEAQVAAARHTLGPLTRVYSDTALQAYRLDRVAAWLDGPGKTTRKSLPLFVGLARGWEPLEDGWYGPFRWLPEGGGRLIVYTPHPQRAILELALYNPLNSPGGTRSLEVWLNGHLAYTLPVADSPDLRHIASTPLELPAGSSRLELRVRQDVVGEGDGHDPDNRRFSFAIHQVCLHLCDMSGMR